MSKLLKSFVVALIGLGPVMVTAQDALTVQPASEIVLADQLYVHRLVVIFADSPQDPAFVRQMEILPEGVAALTERDVLVVTDTAPDAKSELRQKLRPRGFSFVILDKDGRVALRKPLPWGAREISRAIDKFPSRIIEVLERNPAGR